MFQRTSDGNGGGGGGTLGNGYHHGGGSGGAHLTGHLLRRGHGGGSNPRVSQQQQEKERATPPCTDFDVAYFHSHAHLGIHEEMIKDRVRTKTCRNAIFQHRDRIAGKVVVDVGCGIGILSIFCSQAGARRPSLVTLYMPGISIQTYSAEVYTVDASDIAVQPNEVIKASNLSDTIIVLHGRVECCREHFRKPRK